MPATSVTFCSHRYDEIYKSDEIFRVKKPDLGQVLVVDFGCPISLSCLNEYKELRSNYLISGEKGVGKENFKFGPSRLYESKFKVKMPVYLEESKMEMEIFVVDGPIPILLGNAMMEPMETCIDLG